eukprot:Em0001g2360a
MNNYGSENSSDVIAPQNCSIYNLTRASGGQIATVQFLIIKYGLKRVSTRNVLSAFALLMPFAMGFSIVQSAVALWNATITQITGLLFALTRAEPTVLILLLLGHGVPMVITLVTSYMTCNGFVQQNLYIASIRVLDHHTPEDTIASVMVTLFSGVEPFCVLILFITIHKTIRRTIVGAISGCIKSPNSLASEYTPACTLNVTAASLTSVINATVTGKVQNIRRLMQTLGNKDSRRASCSLFSNCKGDICTSPRLACCHLLHAGSALLADCSLVSAGAGQLRPHRLYVQCQHEKKNRLYMHMYKYPDLLPSLPQAEQSE